VRLEKIAASRLLTARRGVSTAGELDRYVHVPTHEKRIMSSEVESILEYLSEEREGSGLPWQRAKVDLAMQELSAHYSNDYNQSYIIEAFDEIAKEGTIDEQSFEAAFERVRSANNQEEDTTWTVYIPIQVELDNSLAGSPSLKIHGQTFRFRKAPSVNQALPLDLDDRADFCNMTRCSDWPAPKIYVSSEVEAGSWNNAWHAVESAFDVFKGFIEFQDSSGNRHWGGDKPLASLPHPKYYIASNGTGTAQGTTFIIAEHETRRPIEITDDYLEGLREESTGLKEVPREKSIDSLVVDALRLYSQSMDERFKEGRFLGLWQTLETLALSDRVSGKTSKICSRTVWHGDRLGLPGSGIKNRMDKIAKKRNDLVHRGIRNINDDDVNGLKLIVDTVLNWLRDKRSDLSTKQHLNLYYQYRTTGSSSLDRMHDVLAFIESSR